MRVFLTARTTFLVGAIVVTGLSVGLYFAVRPSSTNAEASANATAIPHMNGAMSMSGSTMAASNALATRTLTIQHVQRGCHVWSNGKTTGAMMRLHLRPGQKLSITEGRLSPRHRTVEMPGGRMDVKTIRPDNHLRLVVTAA